jgi:hypothetical protein
MGIGGCGLSLAVWSIHYCYWLLFRMDSLDNNSCVNFLSRTKAQSAETGLRRLHCHGCYQHASIRGLRVQSMRRAKVHARVDSSRAVVFPLLYPDSQFHT